MPPLATRAPLGGSPIRSPLPAERSMVGIPLTSFGNPVANRIGGLPLSSDAAARAVDRVRAMSPGACRSSATTSNEPGQTGSLRVSTAAGALMARPISARTTPTTNAITATPKATTDVNSEDCRNAESIAVARFGSSRASSA